MSNDFELDFDEDTATEIPEVDGVEVEQISDGDILGTEESEELVDAELDNTEQDDTDSAADEQAKAAAEAKAKAAAELEAANKSVEDFKSAAMATLVHEDRDQATGELPVILVQGVLDAYGKVPGAKHKALAKAFLTDKMQELMVEGAERPDAFFEARTIMQLSKFIKDAKATSAPVVAKPKVDPTQAHAERIAAMMLAPSLVSVPQGVEGTWATKAQALAESLADDVRKYNEYLVESAKPLAEGEEPVKAPEVSPVVLAAVKIAAGRSVGTTTKRASSGTSTPRVSTAGSGHRGDIGQHIREAMDTVEVGAFLSIADIAKVATSQYGGDKPAPSQGAIAARLFPGQDASKCNLDFVAPEGKEQGHDRKGAVRLS